MFVKPEVEIIVNILVHKVQKSVSEKVERKMI